MKIRGLRYAYFLAAFFGGTSFISAEMPVDIQKANILHCFDWKFNDIKKELPNIAEAGFGAVQVSPVQGNCASGAEWYYAYLPYDFAFNSDKTNGNGSRAALKSLCEEADKYGIKIIVDVVANHINPASGYRDPWWNEKGRIRNEGSVNYNNRNSITHGNLGSYQDVISESGDVQQRMVAFLKDLKDLGVKGIRWDAAKHIALPSEGCDWWAVMSEIEGLWHYGEVLDNPGTSSDTQWDVMREYTGFMSVTDNAFGNRVLTAVKQGKMASSFSTLPSKNIDTDKLVFWGESHDSYANNGGATKTVDQKYIDRAYMLGACRLNETALYFSRPTQTEYSKIKMGVKGSTHVFDQPAVKAINNFRINTVDVEEKIASKAGSEGYFVNARKGTAAAIILPKQGEKDVEVPNPDSYIPEGNYVDFLGGGEFTVTSTSISGHVGEEGVAVLYVNGSGTIEIKPESAPAVYYNLQGVRVENPENGIFIRVEGDKATKVMF